jgi:hypothetical protein
MFPVPLPANADPAKAKNKDKPNIILQNMPAAC